MVKYVWIRETPFDKLAITFENGEFVKKCLGFCACDIQNAYLQAPSSEKHYVVCGPEFGLENVGKYAIIVRALYGGKSAGADYWRHVRSAMEEMGFTSCKADPDV